MTAPCAPCLSDRVLSRWARCRAFSVRALLVLLPVVFSCVFPWRQAAAETGGDRKAGFSFRDVDAMARHLAGRAFRDCKGNIPDFLMNIDYDDWRDIRFDTKRSLWAGQDLPFTVQFFHPGLYYPCTVAINVVEGGRAKKVPFSSSFFNYGRNKFPKRKLNKLGFAGFRLHYPLNTTEYYDEVIVFLGASYFRALARGEVYGLSARGLAIDTVEPGAEEFPYFREFWLVKPKPDANQITIYALLDSPSVAGAFEFVVKPERTALYEKSVAAGRPREIVPPPRETRVDVRLSLYFRRPVKKLGIAPLTSMFQYGENKSIRPMDDFRPEIHDSDGLLVAFRNGEWLWRPLVNPSGFQINSYVAPNPRGFGLFQRDVDFDHYQDIETYYHARPSVWIESAGTWGEGRIELDQIPIETEIVDNIVAYFVPAKPAVPGAPMSYAYSMVWGAPDIAMEKGGRVSATRTAQGKKKDQRKFVVDFKSAELAAISPSEPIAAVVDVASPASLVESQVHKNPITDEWRLVFLIDVGKIPPSDSPVPIELRAFLKKGNDILTETWNYTFQHGGK